MFYLLSKVHLGSSLFRFREAKEPREDKMGVFKRFLVPGGGGARL